jgi:hypothetical protein
MWVPEQRVLSCGDETREDAGSLAQRRIDQHAAVAKGQTCPLGEREVGRGADRDQDGVGVNRRSFAQREPGRFAACGGDFLHGCT